MTDAPQQQPKEHCEHECVCTRHIGSIAWKNSTCCMANHTGCKECIHDSRPLQTSTTAPDDIDLEELGNQDIDPKAFEIYAKTCDEAAKEQYFRELAEKQCQEQHDAAIARQAREQVLNRLDKEIAIRENEMNRKGNLEDNLTTATGYLTAAGALNWVRVVLIAGSYDTIDGDARRSQQQGGGPQ